MKTRKAQSSRSVNAARPQTAYEVVQGVIVVAKKPRQLVTVVSTPMTPVS